MSRLPGILAALGLLLLAGPAARLEPVRGVPVFEASGRCASAPRPATLPTITPVALRRRIDRLPATVGTMRVHDVLADQRLYLAAERGMQPVSRPAGSAAANLPHLPDGAAGLVNAQGSELRGLALTSTDDGFAATVGLLALAGTALDFTDPAVLIHDFADMFEQMGILAVYLPSGWIVLGPEATHALTAPAARERAWGVYVLRHELEHAITPDRMIDNALPWVRSDLEEGIASVLAAEPGVVSRTAAAVGVPVPHIRRRFDGWYGKPDGYGDHVQTVRALGRLAGLRGRQLRDALQRTPSTGVPATLAQAIVERHGLEPRTCAAVARRIRQLDGSTKRLPAFRRDVRRAARTVPLRWG